MLLLFSVARSQDNGQWERATETAPQSEAIDTKPVKAAAKTAANSSFGANLPKMSSAFDTAHWLSAA